MSQPIDSTAFKFVFGVVVFGVIVFLAAIETGVVLAIRVNLHKTWHRLAGAAPILPSTALCLSILGGGLRGLLTTGPAGNLPLCLLFASLALAGLIGLVGHLWLIGLLLVPTPFDPVQLPDRT